MNKTYLCEIATKHNTDKVWEWNYTPLYYDQLAKRCDTIKTVLEVGVWQGASLKTWREFFPNAQVYGIEVEPAWAVNEDRIKTFTCNGYDPTVMVPVMAEIGEVDFFVDDAIHLTDEQISLLNFMWPHMRKGGLYAIEETRTDGIDRIREAVVALPNVDRRMIIYSKNGYHLTLIRKEN